MNTGKMSSRTGKFILLEDVLARAVGEVIVHQIESNQEQRNTWVDMIGSFFLSLENAREKGENTVTFHTDDFLE